MNEDTDFNDAVQKESEVSEQGKFYKGVPEGIVPGEGLVLSGIYESPDGAETKAIPEVQPVEITSMLEALEARRAELKTKQFIPEGDSESRRIVMNAFEKLLLAEPPSRD